MPWSILLNPRILGGLALAGLLAWLAWWWRDTGVMAERARWESRVSELQAEQRAEEARRVAALETLNREHAEEKQRLEADAARADDVVRRLRLAIAASGTGQNPAAPAGSAPVSKVGELFGDCAAQYQRMAREADASRSAGNLCEKAYDSLTNAQSLRERVRANLKGNQP